MEATLVTVTLLSLAAAMALAIVTWRLLQEAHQRADARVAALEQGLAASFAADPAPHHGSRGNSSELHAGMIVELHSAGDPDWLAQFPPSATPDPFAERLFADDDAATRVGASSRGVLAIGLAGGVIVLLIFALWSVGRLMAPGVDARAGAGGAKAGLNAANAAPLELVALEQTRDGETLTIHGVVRNPPAGVMIDRLAVVVAFFDVSGQQLASVRAPLDFRTLAPGDESPFQVSTLVPTGVTRYRVSFRRDEGTIVPHVDRRQQEAS